MLKHAFLFAAVFFFFSCATTPPPVEEVPEPQEQIPEQSIPTEETPPPEEPLPFIEVPTGNELSGLAEEACTLLPRDSAPVSVEGIPVIVAARDDKRVTLIGMASDGRQMYVWSGFLSAPGTASVEKYESIGELRDISHWEPLVVTTDGPTGFMATLVRENLEELVIAIPGDGHPYLIVEPQTAGMQTDIRDINGDGAIELLQYMLVHQAPADREIFLDIFDWTNESFTYRTTISILRTVNSFLESLKGALLDGNDDLLIDVMAHAVAVEGPKLEEVLPVDEVTVPLVSELPIDLFADSWDFVYEFLVRRGNVTGVYRLNLRLTNTFDDEPEILLRDQQE